MAFSGAIALSFYITELFEEPMNDDDRVIVALRKIMRAMDLNARSLARDTGLTTPQLLVMQAIESLGQVTIGRVAQEVNLTQATVTTIIDRLVKHGLVERQRSETDRRKVHAVITQEGHAVLASAPRSLQDRFISRFDALEGWERSFLIAALERVASMMDAEDMDASPVLDYGALDRPPQDSR